MTRGAVPTAPVALTELDARELLAKPLRAVSQRYGPTKVGLTLGCNERTVRDARDEKSTLRIDLTANLMLLDPNALDGILARFGRRSVPLGSRCDTDGNRKHESKVLAAALALSIALADDEKITVREIQANRQALIDGRDALDQLLGRLEVRAA